MQRLQPVYKKTLLLLIYVALAIYVVSFFSLNFRNDEGFTMALVHHSFLNLIRIDSYDVHPPLYYLILKVFLSITTFWTSSIFVKIIFARLFSFISFCLSFYLLVKIFKISQYKINKQFLFILVLLSPSILFFATQIRMYSFGAFLLILGIYIYQKLYKYYSFKFIALFFICMLAASYVHYYYALFAGLFILLSCVLCLLNKKYKRSLIFFVLDVFLCICYLPWLLYTVDNIIGVKHVLNFGLKKIVIQICKIILIPTGVLESSLNGVNIISKLFLILIMYILFSFGIYTLHNKFDFHFKKLFFINIIIASILMLIGSVSDLCGYEFSASFLYPSFLMLIFTIIILLMKSHNVIFKSLFLIVLGILIIMASICNIDNYHTSVNQIQKYERYSKFKKNVYVNVSNSLPHPNELEMQMLHTHVMFHDVDNATMLMYMNKNMVTRRKISNNKLNHELWTNIKTK